MSNSTEKLRASWVGQPPRIDGPIELADYDPAWPQHFEREASRIRGALGSRALRVEHVGSTSVPGLAAKPRIDIMLAVVSSANEAGYVPDLESAGYLLVIREPHWHEHRVFKGPDIDVNLHVLTRGCSEIERMVVFRDWLRTHPHEFELYLSAKRELARRSWAYTQDYADAKAEVVEGILARAGAPARNDDERERTSAADAVRRLGLSAGD